MRAVLIFASIFLLGACTKKTEGGGLAGLEIESLKSFKQTDAKPFSLNGLEGSDLKFSDGEAEAKVKMVRGTDEKSFAKAVEIREFELSRPFREERSPYPGAVTESVKCPDEFRARTKKSENRGAKVWRAEIPQSSRRMPVCRDEDFKLKGVELIVYCPGSRILYTVNAAFPRANSETWEKWFASLKCGAP